MHTPKSAGWTNPRQSAWLESKGLDASVHASIHNPFAQERHLVSREIYKRRRAAALAAWWVVVTRSPLGLGCRATRDELPLD